MDAKKLFGQWINSIPYGQFEKVRSRVVTECRCTNQCFYSWKVGVTAPGALAKERIDQIALEETGRQVYGTLNQGKLDLGDPANTPTPPAPKGGLTPNPLKGAMRLAMYDNIKTTSPKPTPQGKAPSGVWG